MFYVVSGDHRMQHFYKVSTSLAREVSNFKREGSILQSTIVQMKQECAAALEVSVIKSSHLILFQDPGNGERDGRKEWWNRTENI